jgi:hypothetical protein
LAARDRRLRGAWIGLARIKDAIGDGCDGDPRRYEGDRGGGKLKAIAQVPAASDRVT